MINTKWNSGIKQGKKWINNYNNAMWNIYHNKYLTMKQMNKYVNLTHFKPIFNFYTPWKSSGALALNGM